MICTFRLNRNNASTRVAAGEDILAFEIRRAVARQRYSLLCVICDRRVHKLHQELLDRVLPKAAPTYLIAGTEAAKSMNSVRRLLTWLQENQADRHSLIVAVGGGVTTDLVGFAASVYMRGIEYVSVSTTLVGQVDAAIGGKTALNFGAVKNSIGTFYPPGAVICDHQFLTSLREPHIRDGLVEAFKIFCIRSSSHWKKYARTAAATATASHFTELIADAIRLKVDVVNRDPFEGSLRRLLNFGHTAGHAYEAISGHSHGHSVAFGLQVALELSCRHAGLPAGHWAEASAVFAALYDRFDRRATNAELLWEKIRHDKKRCGDAIPFVLLKSTGHHLVRDVNYREFAAAVTAVKQRFV